MPPRQLARLTTPHRRKVRRRPCSAFRSNQWDTTTEQLIAGQQTALGISIQGISQKQLETLKTRMEAAKKKLEQAKAAPQSQREQILNGITGEHLTGDMLTATVWGYFASLQSYDAIAGSQAQIIDLPALSYGLFHAQVKPRKLYGIVTNGIQSQGLNMDVGHLRSIRWVKDDNPQSKINSDPQLTANGKTAAQNRWIAYNKSKGQYSSAMEHEIIEQSWIDKTQCRYTDSNGQIKNPTLNACTEGISAVKAIAIAQQQGQKIYTINKDNRDTALPALKISGNVGAEIRSAIQAGKEVIFHENAINAHGWSGYGYIILDPETGIGAHLIDGDGNGGIAFFLGHVLGTMILSMSMALGNNPSPAAIAAYLETMKWAILPYLIFCTTFLATLVVIYDYSATVVLDCFILGFTTSLIFWGNPWIEAATTSGKKFSFIVTTVIFGWLGFGPKHKPIDCFQ